MLQLTIDTDDASYEIYINEYNCKIIKVTYSILPKTETIHYNLLDEDELEEIKSMLAYDRSALDKFNKYLKHLSKKK